MLIETTLSQFSEQAAAKTPTPGGGSVAAYVGALGAALGTMAARFTEGRRGFEQHAQALASEINRLEAVRDRMQELVQADAGAYDAVTAAYRLPRDGEEQAAARGQAVATALRGALEVPLQTCRTALEGLEVLLLLREHANPNLVSDVAVGAYALAAACRSAWVNVLINLAGLKEEDLERSVRAEGEGLLARTRELEEAIGTSICRDLAG
jgi:glutamate formiminotransferase/formiminotetrahydrofolate cyclodeaminase